MDAPRKTALQHTLFALFALSGFSGLIYESIWTHYLKLFLGHAAYAQTLVLALFMGGMAVGAWLAGRLMPRLRNPLLGYVVVEIVIGVAGLAFHRVYMASSAWMLDAVIPALGSDGPVELVRWSYAALLILPQTLLLGATFPLMSAGLLRAFPQLPGGTISLLYFTNSIGAVLGVLASGFWLIGAVGLPGTILTAGLFNFLLAGAVYFCAKGVGAVPMPRLPAPGPLSPLERMLLTVALVTGLSSFIYEVAWIRMLSLVLGASTHAFELMLAAFILGLALGGLWVRRHIDRFANPLRALGVVQLLMGALALATIVAYNATFDVMAFLMSALQRNDAGYLLFNVGSHLLAVALMLPVTFMAGMTLPLITYHLFSRGSGEGAIGRVYAANTLGAILGVALAMQVLLPYLGLKSALVLGAGLDLLLGIWLLQRAGGRERQVAAVALGCVVLTLAVSLGTRFDLQKMASGVYRHGQFAGGEVLFHRDGRTATVGVVEYRDGTRNIVTNGKPDASVMMAPGKRPRDDEPTMVLIGGLPLLYKPEARHAAVIGMGSGISAAVLLKSPALERLDVIEIESAMMEGARLFGERVQSVYTDPRSHVHIDDAKSYFAAHRSRYDLIVSEPSNPWVSGVATLFSEEFYRRIRTHLHDDGLLVQWFQVYEMSPDVVHSILKAMTPWFDDYAIYAANTGDMVIVASKTGPLPAPDPALFRAPGFRNEFASVQWFGLADVELHRLVDRALLLPLLDMAAVPANSDFFPYVDQHAVAARFRREKADYLLALADAEVPLPGPYFQRPPRPTDTALPIGYPAREKAIHAWRIAQYFADPRQGLPALPDSLATLVTTAAVAQDCSDPQRQALWLGNVTRLMATVLPRVGAAEARPLLAAVEARACRDGRHAPWLALFRAVAERDLAAQAREAERLLAAPGQTGAAQRYLRTAALVARLQLGQDEAAISHAEALSAASTDAVIADLLGAAAARRLAAGPNR